MPIIEKVRNGQANGSQGYSTDSCHVHNNLLWHCQLISFYPAFLLVQKLSFNHRWHIYIYIYIYMYIVWLWTHDMSVGTIHFEGLNGKQTWTEGIVQMALCTVLSKAVLCEAQCETILYNHSGYRSRLQIITVSYENLGIVICSSVST